MRRGLEFQNGPRVGRLHPHPLQIQFPPAHFPHHFLQHLESLFPVGLQKHQSLPHHVQRWVGGVGQADLDLGAPDAFLQAIQIVVGVVLTELVLASHHGIPVLVVTRPELGVQGGAAPDHAGGYVEVGTAAALVADAFAPKGVPRLAQALQNLELLHKLVEAFRVVAQGDKVAHSIIITWVVVVAAAAVIAAAIILFFVPGHALQIQQQRSHARGRVGLVMRSGATAATGGCGHDFAAQNALQAAQRVPEGPPIRHGSLEARPLVVQVPRQFAKGRQGPGHFHFKLFNLALQGERFPQRGIAQQFGQSLLAGLLPGLHLEARQLPVLVHQFQAGSALQGLVRLQKTPQRRANFHLDQIEALGHGRFGLDGLSKLDAARGQIGRQEQQQQRSFLGGRVRGQSSSVSMVVGIRIVGMVMMTRMLVQDDGDVMIVLMTRMLLVEESLFDHKGILEQLPHQPLTELRGVVGPDVVGTKESRRFPAVLGAQQQVRSAAASRLTRGFLQDGRQISRHAVTAAAVAASKLLVTASTVQRPQIGRIRQSIRRQPRHGFVRHVQTLTAQVFELPRGGRFGGAQRSAAAVGRRRGQQQRVDHPHGLSLEIQPAVQQIVSAGDGAGELAFEGAVQRHIEDGSETGDRLESQDFLLLLLLVWGGYQRHQGLPERVHHRGILNKKEGDAFAKNG